ncbi:MAG: tRNA (adenosine(37)-N6)-threonylcarbamoyltransferase complex ATPase subunit type 1 TsaE [Terriglobales bacterium]
MSEFNTPEALQAAAREFAATLPDFAVLVLVGELGAGKTTFAQGLAAGMGVASEREVASPTYTLIHEYHRGHRSFYHLDLYRVETAAQLATLGLEDLFLPPPAGAQKVIAIEWGERVESELPRPYYRLELSAPAADRRRLLISTQPSI